MKTSIFDVAKKSGLSVVTVSRVLNNSSTVRERNRLKVLQAMEELGYRPSAAARSLARGKTGIIGLTITNLYDSFLDAVVKAVNDRLAERGYFLALSVSTAEEPYNGMLFQEDRIEGLILLSPIEEDRQIPELRKKKIPFVLLDNQQQAAAASSVQVNNYKGGYEATMHLIELGHTEIAHISGPELFLSSRERERGFRSAMEDSGLQPFCIERGGFSISSGYAVACRWLESGRLPNAVFAADDLTAFGVMDALKMNGVSIPQDVSIIGFDDHLFATEFRPGLTTVRQPAEQLGWQGVDILLELMKDPTKGNVAVQLDPQLIIRESTAGRH